MKILKLKREKDKKLIVNFNLRNNSIMYPFSGKEGFFLQLVNSLKQSSITIFLEKKRDTEEQKQQFRKFIMLTTFFFFINKMKLNKNDHAFVNLFLIDQFLKYKKIEKKALKKAELMLYLTEFYDEIISPYGSLSKLKEFTLSSAYQSSVHGKNENLFYEIIPYTIIPRLK